MSMATIDFPNKEVQLHQARREFIRELLDEIPEAWFDTGFAVRLSVVTDRTTTFSIRIPCPKQARDEHVQIANCDLLEELVRESEIRGVIALLEAQLSGPREPATTCGDPAIGDRTTKHAQESNVIQFHRGENAPA
jgi:hypothetical protein